ncbi:MAG TPA: NAD(+) synthase [Clostridiaceae bacterium]|nr:NAD(+) synthase [Clostridiaceae bacterium]
MFFGFVRVGAAVPTLKVANCEYNSQEIINIIKKADDVGVQILVFPELSVTGCSCGDLLYQRTLIREVEKQLYKIAESTVGSDIVIIVGAPVLAEGKLFSCGIVINKGKILGAVPKTHVSSKGPQSDGRWFSSGLEAVNTEVDLCNQKVPFGVDLLFRARIKSNKFASDSDIIDSINTVDRNTEYNTDIYKRNNDADKHAEDNNTILNADNSTDKNIEKCADKYENKCLDKDAVEYSSVCFGVEISQDMWNPLPPSSYQALSGAVIVFNLAAEAELAGRHKHRKELIRQQSDRCKAGYVYASSGIYESTTDKVFGGYSLIVENGRELNESERFSLESQLIYSEIDVEKLESIRLKDANFTFNSLSDKLNDYRIIEFMIEGRKYDRLNRPVSPHPFIPFAQEERDARCSEIFSVQTAGLVKRIMHTGLKHGVIGVSGGLDSTLALLVTVKAFNVLGLPPQNILAVTMPGFGTTDSTHGNALGLMKALNTSIREIDIRDACIQHFKDIGHPADTHDVTYENVQARERTQILMDIANKIGGLVIGTGDLSELALGWCTYNGDHMSMYAVNSGVPKTLIPHIIRWAAGNIDVEGINKDIVMELLNNIIDTPITPELLPPDSGGEINQKTEDIVGPYELHDFFIYHILGYGASPEKILFLAEQAFKGKYYLSDIKRWLKLFLNRFFRQQFKRSCLPDGPGVGSISMSPRGEWIMPSDADVTIWLKGLD